MSNTTTLIEALKAIEPSNAFCKNRRAARHTIIERESGFQTTNFRPEIFGEICIEDFVENTPSNLEYEDILAEEEEVMSNIVLNMKDLSTTDGCEKVLTVMLNELDDDQFEYMVKKMIFYSVEFRSYLENDMSLEIVLIITLDNLYPQLRVLMNQCNFMKKSFDFYSAKELMKNAPFDIIVKLILNMDEFMTNSNGSIPNEEIDNLLRKIRFRKERGEIAFSKVEASALKKVLVSFRKGPKSMLVHNAFEGYGGVRGHPEDYPEFYFKELSLRDFKITTY